MWRVAQGASGPELGGCGLSSHMFTRCSHKQRTLEHGTQLLLPVQEERDVGIANWLHWVSQSLLLGLRGAA